MATTAQVRNERVPTNDYANILAAVIGAAALERYPNLRIVFGESGLIK